MIIILIIFTFILWKLLKIKHEIKDNKFIVKSPISIEQLFLSSQQLIIGKNNTIYKGTFNNTPVILKAYKQTNMLIWKNEMTLLKSIEHESIIKYEIDFNEACIEPGNPCLYPNSIRA